MSSRLSLYRRHVTACIYAYSQNDFLFDGDASRADCECPIVARGQLQNEAKRILHRSLNTKEWPKARHTAALWLSWGQTKDPGKLALIRAGDVTVAQAIEMFKSHTFATSTQGTATQGKYEVFFRRRLLPWCEHRGIRFIKELDEPTTIKLFFQSWKNLQPIRGKSVDTTDVPVVDLSAKTHRVELERLRTFLRFCVTNQWIKANYATKDHGVKVETGDIEPKYAWEPDEYADIVATLENLPDEYGRTDKDCSPDDQEKNRRIYAFAMVCRYTGQRPGDVAMLGPDAIETNGTKHYVRLTQQKTGAHVKVPVPGSLVALLRGLSFRAVLDEPLLYKTKRRAFNYGRHFWFFSGATTVENASKKWSDALTRVLSITIKRRQDRNGGRPAPFKHPATPYTFRHYFAITMLSQSVPVEMVSRWLGHSDTSITLKHYAHANKTYHEASYDAYERAIESMEAPKRVPTVGKVVRMRKSG